MKRIIVCSDGTWDRPGLKEDGTPVESNVEWIYRCIADKHPDGTPQVKAYETGIGSSTYSFKDKFWGGSTGWGIDKKIKDLYTFLIMNYETGDHIYLFGFSRGAYTARSLAGFIRNCGILKPSHINLIDKAYELYRDRNVFTSPDSDLMRSFKRNFCFDDITPIKFIGVWDTVCSLGIPLPFLSNYNKERYAFHDPKLSSTVEFAYHALAVDERRKVFLPTLWEQSDKIKSGEISGQVMEQRWFPGVHCNVGGGYPDRGLSDGTLQWMMGKASNTGLYFDPDEVFKANIKPDYKGKIYNSYTLLYWFWRRVWRFIDLTNSEGHEVLDQSTINRYRDPSMHYRPKNLERKVE